MRAEVTCRRQCLWARIPNATRTPTPPGRRPRPLRQGTRFQKNIRSFWGYPVFSPYMWCAVSVILGQGVTFRLSLKMHYRCFTSEIPSRHCREHVNCWIWNQVWSMHLPMPSAFATRRVYSRGFDFMAMALSPGNADTTDAQRLRN